MEMLKIILGSIFSFIVLIPLAIAFILLLLVFVSPILLLTIPFYILAFLIYLICKILGVITLCGSSKFKSEFEKVQLDLTLQGNIVLSLPIFSHNTGQELSNEQMFLLSDMHKQKIDMADEIFVVNPEGYIGKNTMEEIEYAKSKNKIIKYLMEVNNE